MPHYAGTRILDNLSPIDNMMKHLIKSLLPLVLLPIMPFMPLWWSQASGALPALEGGGSYGSEWDLLALVWVAGPVVKGVLLLLFAFSVISWAIMIAKFRQLKKAQGQDREFLELFWAAPELAAALEETRHLTFSPAAAIFRQGYLAAWPQQAPPWTNPAQGSAAGFPGGEVTRRVVGQALQEQSRRLSQSLTFLATCGNTAPFIGLFGTVWGIMTSFHTIGLKGAASLATVAPGIAEALIATAAGLAAAIPAVVAYNYFLGRVRRLEADLTLFANDLLPLLAPSRGGSPEKANP